MGLRQTKKFLHSKGNHQQNEKATYWIQKKFASHVSDKGLIIKICEKLIQHYNKSTNNLILKMSKGSEETSFQRRHTDNQQVRGKVLNITNHQGNAN